MRSVRYLQCPFFIGRVGTRKYFPMFLDKLRKLTEQRNRRVYHNFFITWSLFDKARLQDNTLLSFLLMQWLWMQMGHQLQCRGVEMREETLQYGWITELLTKLSESTLASHQFYNIVVGPSPLKCKPLRYYLQWYTTSELCSILLFTNSAVIR